MVNRLLGLTRRFRLSDREAIAAVFNKPQYKVQNKSGLFLVKRNNLGYSRIVIIVSKKNIRRAVDRNRLKRVLRAHFQADLALLSQLSLDLVFVARRAALDTLWNTSNHNDAHRLWIKLLSSLQKDAPLVRSKLPTCENTARCV